MEFKWQATSVNQNFRTSTVDLIFIGPVKQKNQRKIVIIFLPIRLKMCFGCSKEPSHPYGSFEYPQHMFWLRNKKINFCYTLLSGGLYISDVRELIQVDDAMEDESLRFGPNGGLIFCME